MPALETLFVRQWYVDDFYRAVVVRINAALAGALHFVETRGLDAGFNALGLNILGLGSAATRLQSGWVQVYAGEGPIEYNAGTIRCDKTGAAVHFKGDTPIIKYNFWSVETAACPEPFIGIHLASGEVQEWTNEYVFTVE